MGSGLIYIIIVGMWIAYFLPRWVANHEEVSTRSIERFAATMRTVGRTAGSSGASIAELMQRREREIAARRILFGSILTFSALVVLLIASGMLAPLILTIPISAIALYVVHARHQVSALNRELAMATQDATTDELDNPYLELLARSRRIAASKALDSSEISNESWTPLADRQDRSTQELHGITIIPKGSAERVRTWEPTSVPAPTYQSASRAAPRRRIDLTVPGVWRAENEAPLTEVIAPSPSEIFDQDLAEAAAEQLRTNRAANE